jgi:PAS domain S-box-containing protein
MAVKKRSVKKYPNSEPVKGRRLVAGMPDDHSELRRRAEEMMLKPHGKLKKIPPADVQRILYELQVHQIELEMQNEELLRVQQDLEASREKYFDRYDLAPVGYLSLNEKGIILEANLTAAALIGRAGTYLVQQLLSRFIYAEDQDVYYLFHKELFKKGTVRMREVRMVRKDGAPFWVRMDSAAVKNIDSSKGLLVSIIDISEQREAQESLVRAKEEWELTFDCVPELIAIIDKEYRIRRVNNAMAKRLGRKAGECVGLLCHEAMHGSSGPPENCPLARTLRDGLPHSEEMHEGCLGGHFVIGSTPLCNKLGQMTGAVHVAHDITERKQAEDLLRESEGMFKSLAESALVGIYLMQDDRFKYVNPRFAELFGYAVDECLDQKFYDTSAHPDDMPLIRENMRGRLCGEIPNAHYEFRGIKKTGEIINVEVFGSGVIYKQKPAIIGTMLDISQRKQAEEELRISHNELENRVKERTRELLQVNESLNVLVSELKLSKETISAHEKDLKSLVIELTSTEDRERRRIAKTLHENIGQILALIRIELGALTESVKSAEACDEIRQIRALIGEVMQFVRTLTVDLCPPMLYELGFYAAVQQLVEQFLEKYNISFDFIRDGEGGPIDQGMCILLFNVVRELMVNVVKHAKAQTAAISLLRDANEIKITVEDYGIGYDTTQIRPNGSNEGFGILNISERLHSIGGRIEIKSVINSGTTVFVTVPWNHPSNR